FEGATRERHQGHTAVRAFITRTYANQPADRRTKHLCGNSLIDVAGDNATAETDFVAYERIGSDPWRVHTIGRYHDRLTLDGGQWRFAERRVVTSERSTAR
ncbi:MAG TPA: nuclear transport factor 2 family protein, partial [Chloroflexota bacterium]|nr:nuclear transport factor 2 family protein [Chloroflexota bacterium]